MDKRNRFSQEFKLEAVRLLEAGNRPAAELARQLAIPRNRLYKMQEQVRKKGVGALPGSGQRGKTAGPTLAHPVSTSISNASGVKDIQPAQIARCLIFTLTMSPGSSPGSDFDIQTISTVVVANSSLQFPRGRPRGHCDFYDL